MTLLLLLGLVVAVAAAVYVVGTVRHRRIERRAVAALHRRLVEAYPPADHVPETVPLRAPAGRIAIEPAGLCLHVGPEGEPVDLRQVPWKAIRTVSPVAGGQFSVHVSRVGDVQLPGALGRQIWEGVGRATATPSA